MSVNTSKTLHWGQISKSGSIFAIFRNFQLSSYFLPTSRRKYPDIFRYSDSPDSGGHLIARIFKNFRNPDSESLFSTSKKCVFSFFCRVRFHPFVLRFHHFLKALCVFASTLCAFASTTFFTHFFFYSLISEFLCAFFDY